MAPPSSFFCPARENFLPHLHLHLLCHRRMLLARWGPMHMADTSHRFRLPPSNATLKVRGDDEDRSLTLPTPSPYPSMPLAPNPPTNPNGVSNRLAAPTKQASSVSDAQWPVLTQSAYMKLQKAATVAGDKELEKLPVAKVRLAHARNKLWQTITAYDAALRETRTDGPTPDAKVHNELRSQRKLLEKCVTGFPLEVR